MNTNAPILQSKLTAGLLLAALLLLLMLPNFLRLSVSSGLQVWVNSIVFPIVFLVMLFAMFARQIWMLCILLAPPAAIAPLEAFYVSRYSRPSSSDILATVFATNIREVWEYFGGTTTVVLGVFVLLGGLLGLVAGLATYRSSLQWQNRSRSWFLAATVSLPLAVVTNEAISSSGGLSDRLFASLRWIEGFSPGIKDGFPFGLPQRIAEYYADWKTLTSDAASLDDFRFHATKTAEQGQRQIYVLAIGESSRLDHWQLFGYSRPTNPLLLQLKNIVPISNMTSAWSVSVMAIPMIVTRKPPENKELSWKEASILRAMSEAGFDTYWISNQAALGKYDSPVSLYALEANHVQFINFGQWTDPGGYDEALLQPLRTAIKLSNRDLFIVLHMMGSHQGYDFRYPEQFRLFKPTISDTSANVPRYERVGNSYDNTIAYTDSVLSRIVETLAQSSAISALWYESDHGEDLANSTCDLSGHGNGTRHDFEIPAFVWYSDSYAKAFPSLLSTLRSNSNERTMSANTFESLVDMAGVDFPGHDRTQSLFSSEWLFRRRMVTSEWSVDFDSADVSERCNVLLPRR